MRIFRYRVYKLQPCQLHGENKTQSKTRKQTKQSKNTVAVIVPTCSGQEETAHYKRQKTPEIFEGGKEGNAKEKQESVQQKQ